MASTTQRESVHIYQQQCPILHAMELIGAKWKIPILWYLSHDGPIHYNELRRRVAGVTNTALTRCLRELEKDSIIERHSEGTVPPSVTYSLTDMGKLLIHALDGLYQWGEQHQKASRPLP